jgi:glycogen(starch) synthase
VRFAGALPRAELHGRLRAATALVVPSRREGLGLVAVEAILLGVPVVASHTGGLPGALGAPGAPLPPPGGTQPVPGGLLVRVGDVAGLAAALGLLGGLAGPGDAAVAAADRHRPRVVAARHAELYTAAVEGSRSRAVRAG